MGTTISPRALRIIGLLIAVGALSACSSGGVDPGGAASSGGGGAGGSSPVACADMSLGVCTINDAGVSHIALSQPGANGLAVDPATGLVYVVINGAQGVWCGGPEFGPEGLSIVDPASGSEVAMVPTGGGPVWPLVDPARKQVYVAGSAPPGTVVAHDPASGAIKQTFTLGGKPHDLGLDPQGSRMLVSNTFDMSQTYVSLLDVNSGAVISNIKVPSLPHKVVVDEQSRVAYVVSLGAGEITPVDLTSDTAGSPLSSGSTPQTSAMVYSPSRHTLYVGKTAGATPTSGVTIVGVDVKSGALTSEVGTFTPKSNTPTRAWGGFGLDDAHGLLYAAVANSNLVAVIDVDSSTTLGVFEVDACPWAVALDITRGVGYVSSNGSAFVTVFTLSAVMAALGRT